MENESFTFESCWRIAQLKITSHRLDEKMLKNTTERAQNFCEKEDNLNVSNNVVIYCPKSLGV